MILDGRYAVVFWALHGYFVPTNKIVTKDSSGKSNVTKYTIKDSQESFLYIGNCQQQVEEHIRFLKSKKKSIQPFILCTGDDIKYPTDISVYFDDIRYQFLHILRAVDICYKIIYLFDLDFPLESEMFWNFIEHFFFKTKGRHSFPKVHLLSEYLKENRETDKD